MKILRSFASMIALVASFATAQPGLAQDNKLTEEDMVGIAAFGALVLFLGAIASSQNRRDREEASPPPRDDWYGDDRKGEPWYGDDDWERDRDRRDRDRDRWERDRCPRGTEPGFVFDNGRMKSACIKTR